MKAKPLFYKSSIEPHQKVFASKPLRAGLFKPASAWSICEQVYAGKPLEQDSLCKTAFASKTSQSFCNSAFASKSLQASSCRQVLQPGFADKPSPASLCKQAFARTLASKHWQKGIAFGTERGTKDYTILQVLNRDRAVWLSGAQGHLFDLAHGLSLREGVELPDGRGVSEERFQGMKSFRK